VIRESNETLISYIRRILANDDIDKGEQYELIFGDGVAYDTARKQLRGVQNLLDKIDEEEIESINDVSLLEKIETAQQNLKKERIKLSSESLLYNRKLREEARQELIDEKIIEAIENIMVAPPPLIIAPTKNDLELSLCIADEHIGCEFEIKDLAGQVINKYNNQIFEQRMWQVLAETLPYSKDFKKIKVFDLSDAIEGIIHFSQLMNLEYGAIDSAVYFGKFMLRWLHELSQKFMVEIGVADSNHTQMRILTGKKNDFPQENLTKVIRAMIEIGTANNPNISLLPCTDVGSVYTQVAGFDILAVHGHEEKRNLEESFKDYTTFYSDNNIDYMLIGPLHYNGFSDVGANKCIIQIPSIVGASIHSQKIKKRANAGATVLVFEKDKGLVDQHNIILN
jgi:hypothetical protein